MQWNAPFWLIVALPVFGMTQSDNAGFDPNTKEWNSVTFVQEDKIYSHSVWTFADNPALAGFDRKLAVAYRFRAKNLSMGVPNDEGNLELAFINHEAFIDYGFGGEKKNWGIGLYYNNEKEFQHTYHRASLSTSCRILIQDHSIIFGLGGGVQFSRLEDWDRLRFSDEYNPRYGFIYPTQEVRPNESRLLSFINFGLRYNWKRLFFGYALQSGPNGAFALYGPPTLVMHNRLRVGYHFNIEDDITVSPEFVANISTSYYNEKVAEGVQIGKATNNYPLFSGYVTITYKDAAYGQIGIVNHNRMALNFGYQFRDLLVIYVGTSGYFIEEMAEIGGWASIEGGIRIQLKTDRK